MEITLGWERMLEKVLLGDLGGLSKFMKPLMEIDFDLVECLDFVP